MGPVLRERGCVVGELSRIEQDDLGRCEAALEHMRAAFIEAGMALAEIRERRLYREEFGSFEEYVESRWGLGRIHAYRMINAARVARNLLPMGDTPKNERQARALTRLGPAEQRAAWARALETTDGRQPTGKQVGSVVEAMFPKGGATARGSASSDRADADGAGVLEGSGSAAGSSSVRSDGAADGIRASAASRRIIPGDARWALPALADESVQCSITSPPYFGLRDCGHPDQIGLERTVKEYLGHLVEVFREVRRILRPDGVVWINLGDRYHRTHGLLGIPDIVARALVRDGWFWMDRIVWAKAVMKGDELKGHCMTGSQRNRCTTSHEVVLMFVKSRKYYFDIHGERSASGATLRSVWEIAIEPNPGGHFALMPIKLAERCIKLATSEKGCCPVCLAPWRRLVEREQFATRTGENSSGVNRASSHEDSPYHDHRGQVIGNRDPLRLASVYHTVGWEPTCTCGVAETMPCTVLDPFAGLATTAIAAASLGRSSIMIELNPEYCEDGRRRLEGMFP
jgi:site-specific DNA-methyltransferase (adenine-specific)